jgi:type IV fimbrial biogenesis protein FimT
MAQKNRIMKSQAGFSLIETLMVAAIGTIITALAVPSISTTIANVKIRSSMSSVSGLVQNCRMMAVQQNRTMTARYLTRGTSPFGLVYYVKNAADTNNLLTSDPQVELEAPISPFTTPSGAGAPSAISDTILSFTPQTGDPSFNSRGLPCAYDSLNGVCPNVGFIKYFKDNRISGSGGWSAISISPAGRVKRWFWNGSSWAE